MSTPDPLAFFGLVLRAALLSTSGLANLPALRADLAVDRDWATDVQFAEALAVGQVAPGPNGLWVASLGYRIDGLRGAALATVAICLPPLLVLPLARLIARVQDRPAVDGFVRGLSAAVIGVFAVAMGDLLGVGGIDAREVGIAALALGVAATRRVPVTLLLAGAAVLGIVLG